MRDKGRRARSNDDLKKIGEREEEGIMGMEREERKFGGYRFSHLGKKIRENRFFKKEEKYIFNLRIIFKGFILTFKISKIFFKSFILTFEKCKIFFEGFI